MSTPLPDHRDWEAIARHCRDIELPAEQRAAAEAAIRHLMELFGIEYLRQVDNHPLYSMLWNFAPWTRLWLTWLVEALRQLETAEGFEHVRRRLVDPERADEALQLVMVGSRMRSVGFKLEFEPSVDVGGRAKKRPDLHLYLPETREELFVEVTSKGWSTEQREAWETSHSIFLALNRLLYPYCGRIHKVLSRPTIAALQRRIQEAQEALKNGEGMQIVDVPGTIELGIARGERNEELRAWAGSRGIEQQSLSGPPISVDEVSRVRSAFRDKRRQLPHGRHNVVVILSRALLLRNAGSANALAQQLEEALFDIPELNAVVIWESIWNACEPERTLCGAHIYSRTVAASMVRNDFLLLRNPYAASAPSAAVQTRIEDAFARS